MKIFLKGFIAAFGVMFLLFASIALLPLVFAGVFSFLSWDATMLLEVLPGYITVKSLFMYRLAVLGAVAVGIGNGIHEV